MHKFKVSVVMSVYNGERYLREAVASILGQTFRDFEFIIVDDGSTDGTWAILQSYDDPRIVLLRNEENIGLTRSLNKGLTVARGEYIARMDADDVSLPERFAKQVAYMDADPSCCAVVTKIAIIDSEGNPLGYWPEDMRTITLDEIRRELPRMNCVAHPSAMIRASVAREYLYNEHLLQAQDYELWLRLCSDGKIIKKIDEILLYYRKHSMTVSSQTIPELKDIRVKTIFLWGQAARFRLNWFDSKVFVCLLRDLILFIKMRTKSILKRVLIPLGRLVLVSLGRLVGSVLPWRNRSSLFFVFPFYDIGGAEKVHADIVNCVTDQKPWVFFADKSKDKKFKFLFQQSGARLFDISFFTSNRFTFHVCAGALATVINRHSNAVVFGSNTEIYYHLISYLKPDVRRIELLHAFGGAENISLSVVTEIDNRVVVNLKTLHDLMEQYAAHDIGSEFVDRIVLIENRVSVPDIYPDKQRNNSLRVLYVGRGTEEKRVHLAGRAATRCQEIGIPAEFIFVGDVCEAIDVEDRRYCVFKGEIADPNQLDKLYDEADVIVLTSSREGFPMVIMEAMAHGVVPVTTNVGGIPIHVRHKVNGMLITDDNESTIVDSLVSILRELSSNRLLLESLSLAAYEYARKHFAPSRFCGAYRQLILGCGKK